MNMTYHMTLQQEINKQLSRLDKLLFNYDTPWLKGGFFDGLDRFYNELKTWGWEDYEKNFSSFTLKYDYGRDNCLLFCGKFEDADSSWFKLFDLYEDKYTTFFVGEVLFTKLSEFINTYHLQTPATIISINHPDPNTTTTSVIENIQHDPTVLNLSTDLLKCGWSISGTPTANYAVMKKETPNSTSIVEIEMIPPHVNVRLNKNTTLTDTAAWEAFYQRYLNDYEY
jgi:hypothetical protein